MLNQKNVLITGGTGLLGRALVRRSLEVGGRVTFTYFQNERAARELQDAGAQGVQADLRSPDVFLRLKNLLKERSGGLDILIHNAAVARDSTVSKMDEQAWDEVIDVNLTAAYRLVKALLPLLYKSERAKLLFVSSRAGRLGAFGASNYAASKAGLEAFARSLAREVGRKGILVNAVTPGFLIGSAMTRDLPESVKASLEGESVLERASDPEEAARHIVALLSDETTLVSGQVFDFDARITRGG